MKSINIYGLHNGDGVIRYVGKTNSLNKRLNQHITSALRKNRLGLNKVYKDNWILDEIKKGNNIKIISLEKTNKEDWQEREIFWITQYENLTNHSKGGYGGNGYITYSISYDDAKKIIHPLKIESEKKYITLYKIGVIPKNIPLYPSNCISFKKEWKGWGDYLGHGKISDNEKSKKYLSYEDAKKIISPLKLHTSILWYKYTINPNFPDNLPKKPDRFYKNKGWVGFGEFLGNGTVSNQKKYKYFLTYENAVEYVGNLFLKTRNEYFEFHTENQIRNLPKQPDKYYKSWVNWGTFLGKK